MKIVIDAMGGDNAPHEIIKGAIIAKKEFFDVDIVLVGDEEKINKELLLLNSNEKFEIIHTSEYIEMNEIPSAALKKKKNASMVVGANIVRSGDAQALISAGNTGALLESALFNIGRIKGIKRPALITTWPLLNNKKGIILDSGANVDSKPDYLYQFAQMGSIYCQKVLKIENPRVGLLNIGSEENKGDSLHQAAYAILKGSKINFIGNIEVGRFFKGGIADVGVCDGFTGNMVLKTAEGVAYFLTQVLKEEINKNFIRKLGAVLMKPALKELKARLDHSEHGGALLAGLNGICIKSHGHAVALTIKNAVNLAVCAVKNDVVKIIAQEVSQEDKVTA